MRKLLLLAILISRTAFADPSFEDMFNELVFGSHMAASSDSLFTVDDGLTVLAGKPKFKPLFQHYTLVRESLSLQTTDAQNPRALMFGNTGRLLITFTGNKGLNGGPDLEVAEMDEATNNVYFRQVLFKDDLPPEVRERLGGAQFRSAPDDVLESELSLKPSEIQFENEKLLVTTPNPRKCMECHSLIPNVPVYARYIWDSYRKWPRLYGKNDDILNSEEVEALRGVKDYAKKIRRYQLLEGMGREYAPFSSQRRKPDIDRPNLMLTRFLAINQAKVLAQYVLDNQPKEKLKQFSDQMRCLGSNEWHPILRPLTAGNDFVLEAAMSMDRLTVTSSRGGFGLISFGFTTGADTIYGGNNLKDYVIQELFFNLNKDEAGTQQLLIANQDISLSGTERMSLETQSFLKTRESNAALWRLVLAPVFRKAKDFLWPCRGVSPVSPFRVIRPGHPGNESPY